MKKFFLGLFLAVVMLTVNIQPAFAATAFQATAGKATAPTVQRGGNIANVVASTYTLTAALVINDTIKMLKIPKGAIVTRVRLVSDSIDTNATKLVTLSVGDSGSATRYLSASTVGQAGGAAESALAPYTYTADDYISVLCAAAPATGVVGNISVVVEYIIP